MEGVEVAVPAPVMGTPGVCATAVLMERGVGLNTPGKLQASKVSKNTEANKSFEIVFRMFLLSVSGYICRRKYGLFFFTNGSQAGDYYK